MKNTRFFALLLCFILLLTACGAKAPSEEMGMADNGFYSEEYDMVPGETSAAMELTGDSALSAPMPTDRKLIKIVSMNAETEHYDDLIPALDSKITALGGYVESRETGNYSRTRRWTRMTVRIPAEQLGDFVTHVGENANVLSTSEQTQDVTIQYADTEAKLTALRTEQTRLLELLSQAQNLGEILEIEARLSDVTYELERYESQKRGYDNRITYATVTLHIQEVAVLTPVEEPTVWKRISDGFRDSLDGVGDGLVDIFVFLIAQSPYLVVFAAAIWGISILVRKLRRKRQKSKQSPPSQTP